MLARTGTVLIKAHHLVGAGHIGGPTRDGGAEGHVVLSGQPHQDLRPRALEHSRDRGVAGARQPFSAAVVSAETMNDSTPACPVPSVRVARPAWVSRIR